MLPHFEHNYLRYWLFQSVTDCFIEGGSWLLAHDLDFLFVAKIKGGGTSVIWATEGGLNGRFAAGYIHNSIGHRLDGGVLPWSF